MRLTITCLCLFFCSTAIAQPVYETYTPANGLVDARVTGMVQDKYGRLIIYTREGFSIYDGQRFTNILSINNEPVGIVSNYIFLPDSTLYLVRFNGNPIKIEKDNISYDSVLLKGISEISEVKKLNDSTSLLLSNYGTYLLINKSQKKLTNTAGIGLAWLTNVAFGATGKNKLLLCNNDGAFAPSLFLYDIKTAAVTSVIEGLVINKIVQDKAGAIYILTLHSGIKEINAAKLQEDKIEYTDPWFLQYVDKDFKIENIIFDNENNIWCIDVNRGCYKINITTHVKTFYSYTSGLFKNITTIYQDKEFNYWFLTYGKGIQKLVQSNYEEVNEINSTAILRRDYTYNLPGNAVFINGHTKQFALQNNNAVVLPASKKNTTDGLIFWQNQYWHFKDKNTLENQNKVSINFNLPENENKRQQLSNKIKTDKDGNILIGGTYFYILLQNGTYAAAGLPYFTDNIVADDDNNYWAFDRGNSLAIVYTYKHKQLVKIKEFKLPAIAPRCAALWNKDTFLIGTRYNGLLFVKAANGAVKPFLALTREKGLSNNFILDIIKLNKNKIALATASGADIINFSGTDTSLQKLSLGINVYDPVANLVADSAGNLYAVSEYTGKLYKYTANRFNDINYYPTAFFNQIWVNKEKISSNKNIFKYDENNFLFQAGAPSYIDNRNITFYFSLQGKTNKELFNNSGDFEVNNLEPGKYELLVRIVYPGGIYPEQKLYYTFKINQPFWKTWWFILLIIMCSALLIGYFIRNFYSKKLERQKSELEKQYAIEQERTRMARELHDGLGSMLSGIKHSFAALKNQVIMDSNLDNKFNSNIEKLNDTIKELRNISHSISPDGLLLYGLENSLRDYCNNITSPGVLNISFKALDTEKMLLTEEQAFHSFRIVQELLQNIIKHSGASNAIVQISYNHNCLYITVEDDGKGFEIDDDLNKKGMGLKNIESRIKILKGKMDYRTTASEGTSVLMEIPCAEKNI